MSIHTEAPLKPPSYWDWRLIETETDFDTVSDHIILLHNHFANWKNESTRSSKAILKEGNFTLNNMILFAGRINRSISSFTLAATLAELLLEREQVEDEIGGENILKDSLSQAVVAGSTSTKGKAKENVTPDNGDDVVTSKNSSINLPNLSNSSRNRNHSAPAPIRADSNSKRDDISKDKRTSSNRKISSNARARSRSVLRSGSEEEEDSASLQEEEEEEEQEEEGEVKKPKKRSRVNSSLNKTIECDELGRPLRKGASGGIDAIVFFKQELLNLAKNYFLFGKYWEEQDYERILGKLNDGNGLLSLGWKKGGTLWVSKIPISTALTFSFFGRRLRLRLLTLISPNQSKLVGSLAQNRSLFQSKILEKAGEFAKEWCLSDEGRNFLEANPERMVALNGNIQPHLPPTSSFVDLRTRAVTTSVFDYCIKSSDVDRIFSDQQLATRLVKSAVILIRIETWHQREAFGNDGRLKLIQSELGTRDGAVFAGLLKSCDLQTQAFNNGQPILFPLNSITTGRKSKMKVYIEPEEDDEWEYEI